MAVTQMTDTPSRTFYDVVIIGGAIMGSSAAWWLTELGFDGTILVLERDPSYEKSATALTNSCIRQQFTTELNVRISQFTAEFLHTLRDRMGGDDRVPEIGIQNFGYLYLADTEAKAENLRAAQKVQRAAGAETRLMTQEEIAEAYPFYNLDDIVLGSINTKDEGYWDGGSLFEWFRRSARSRGVEYVAADVTAMTVRATRVTGVTLADGQRIACGHVVNASGTRAACTARMVRIDLPVEPRKRFSWVFKAETAARPRVAADHRPLGRACPAGRAADLPCRREAGAGPERRPERFHDGSRRSGRIASGPPSPRASRSSRRSGSSPNGRGITITTRSTRTPSSGRIRRSANFLFLNGFSGHGLQQSPAMGRGMAEWLMHGEFRSMDLGPFLYDRIAAGKPYLETAVI